jgi:hypothetical protein
MIYSFETRARRKNSRETKAFRVGPAEERVERDVADKVVRALGASLPTLKTVQEGCELYSEGCEGWSDSQRDELPTAVLLVNVLSALDVQEHEDLHSPVVLLESWRLPIAGVSLKDHLVVLGGVPLRQDLPRPRRAAHARTLALALSLAIHLLVVLLPERANLGPQWLELERVLLHRFEELGPLLGVRRGDEVVQSLLGVVGLDLTGLGELGIVLDVKVLIEATRGEAEL